MKLVACSRIHPSPSSHDIASKNKKHRTQRPQSDGATCPDLSKFRHRSAVPKISKERRGGCRWPGARCFLQPSESVCVASHLPVHMCSGQSLRPKEGNHTCRTRNWNAKRYRPVFKRRLRDHRSICRRREVLWIYWVLMEGCLTSRDLQEAIMLIWEVKRIHRKILYVCSGTPKSVCFEWFMWSYLQQ